MAWKIAYCGVSHRKQMKKKRKQHGRSTIAASENAGVGNISVSSSETKQVVNVESMGNAHNEATTQTATKNTNRKEDCKEKTLVDFFSNVRLRPGQVGGAVEALVQDGYDDKDLADGLVTLDVIKGLKMSVPWNRAELDRIEHRYFRTP